jgi:two-component system chemotaxis family response regulator WspR
MVLLVDDQLLVGEAVRRALDGESDIEFHFCCDPARAIAVAEQIAPTVILQDLVMPGVDGLALVRTYRSHRATRDIPIIVLSSQEEARTKSEAFAAGANDYLVKLPDRLELIARVRYHSRAHLNHVQRDEAYRALRESQRQLTEANLELQRLMNLDGLTGLNNRRRFDEYLQIEWRRAAREQIPLSLLIVDVDHFKRYNDSHGHLGGDEALREVAKAIQGSCHRPADLPARFGGEEFAIILPDTPSPGAGLLAETIRKRVERIELNGAASGGELSLTVSVGVVTTVPSGNASPLEFLTRADQALYEAKRQGRNCSVIA